MEPLRNDTATETQRVEMRGLRERYERSLLALARQNGIAPDANGDISFDNMTTLLRICRPTSEDAVLSYFNATVDHSHLIHLSLTPSAE